MPPITRRRFLAATASTGLLIGTRLHAREKRWRVGIIGHTGRGDYGHGLHTMWQAVPETEVAGVSDPDASGLEKTRQKLGGVPGFADYHRMLEEVRPEIVAICPRHIDQHREMALAAIAGGVKGIYMEKPFCRTPAEADEIVEACKRSGAKLALAHRNRYHPALPVVKRLLDEGLVGRVLELRARGKEDKRGGGLDLWVLGSHLMNLAHYLAGRPLRCSAQMFIGGKPVQPGDVTIGGEGVGPIGGDRLHARFEMESGAPCFFDSIREAGVPAAGFGLQVIGTKGIVDLRVDAEPLAHFLPGSPFQPVAEPRAWVPITSAGVGKPEPIAGIGRLVSAHELPARDLITAIVEDRPALCSEEEGRVTVEMITAVFASHVRGGEIVAIPLSSRSHPLQEWSAGQSAKTGI